MCQNNIIRAADTKVTRVCMDTGPDFFVLTKDYEGHRKQALRARLSTGVPVSQVLEISAVVPMTDEDRGIARFFVGQASTVIHRENLIRVHQLNSGT